MNNLLTARTRDIYLVFSLACALEGLIFPRQIDAVHGWCPPKPTGR